MPKKKIVLTFPKELVSKPIVYHLVKDYNLILNILRAQVMPDEEGKMVIELEGAKQDIDKGLDYIRKQRVGLELLGKDIKVDEKNCIDCGACVSVCLSKALVINSKTSKLEFDRAKCVLCGFCVSACPVRAIEVTL